MPSERCWLKPLTSSSPSTLTFTTGNWWVAQTVTVDASKSPPPVPVQPLKTFPVQQHVVSSIAGPLCIEGYVDAAADRSIHTAIKLPGDHVHEIPVPTPEAYRSRFSKRRLG